jgi:asparagine synthetase B (glutamine-hydrolysing)
LTDYLAQKPTFYRVDQRAAASEPDVLWAMAPTTPDPMYFAQVAKWGYCVDLWRTPYREVRRAPPGCHVVVTLGGREKRIMTDKLAPFPIGAFELKQEIEAAVARRVLSSDVPVAALVSGGLDSSIVYTLARRYGEVRPYFADSDDENERDAVDLIAPGGTSVLKWSDVTFDDAIRYMQEPVDLGSLWPQIALARGVKEQVCLTGDGADEFFSGYGRAQIYDSQQSDVWHELVNWHLPRLDRVMMRHTIELRSPFLARRVAAAALAMPWNIRRGKQVLRVLFRDDLPTGLADRPKKPLRTPEVESDRPARTMNLIRLFWSSRWPDLPCPVIGG